MSVTRPSYSPKYNIPPVLTTTNHNVNDQQTTFGTGKETYDLNGNLATVTTTNFAKCVSVYRTRGR